MGVECAKGAQAHEGDAFPASGGPNRQFDSSRLKKQQLNQSYGNNKKGLQQKNSPLIFLVELMGVEPTTP